MIRRVYGAVIACFMVVSLGGGAAAMLPYATVSAADQCASNFFGFPAWYNGLTNSDHEGNSAVQGEPCDLVQPSIVGGVGTYIWIIVLNVIDMAFVAIGYIAFFMILYGGFRFLTSAGNAAGVEQGKKTLTNAIIGLVVAIAAVGIDNLIFGIITGFKG